MQKGSFKKVFESFKCRLKFHIDWSESSLELTKEDLVFEVLDGIAIGQDDEIALQVMSFYQELERLTDLMDALKKFEKDFDFDAIERGYYCLRSSK